MKNLDEKIAIQNDKHFEMRNIDMNYNLVIGYIKIFLEFVAILLLILLVNNNVLTVAVAIVLYNYRTTVLTNFMDIVSELLDECKNFNISSERVFAIVNNRVSQPGCLYSRSSIRAMHTRTCMPMRREERYS